MSNLSVLSLFSGCGGFDIGALSWGCLDVIWANDIDAAAAQAYKHMVPCGEFHHGDVQKVQSFPKADILIGCYPCTGFSMGARRRAKGMEERDLMSIKGNFLYQEFCGLWIRPTPNTSLWKTSQAWSLQKWMVLRTTETRI